MRRVDNACVYRIKLDHSGDEVRMALERMNFATIQISVLMQAMKS